MTSQLSTQAESGLALLHSPQGYLFLWWSFSHAVSHYYRGFKEAEMDRVVALIDSALKLAVEIQVKLPIL